MKKLLAALSLLAILSACSSNPNGDKSNNSNTKTVSIDYSNLVSTPYSNPLYVSTKAGVEYKGEIADPSVVRDDETGEFYCFATDRNVLRSEDGVNFELYSTGDNFMSFPTWGDEVRPGKKVNVWAPDVQKIGDTWYYFYSLSGWGSCCGVGYGISDNIGGPYEDMGKLFSYTEIEIENAIDPNVIVDDETGNIYMTVGSFQGNYILELEQNEDKTISLFGGLEYQRDNKVLIAGRPGNWDGNQYEGGYIIKREGYYYFFGSSGTCCAGERSTYRVMVGKSKDITGPYKDSDGFSLTMSGNGVTRGSIVLWGGGPSYEVVAGPGHNSIVQDDAGDYWIYYHSYSSNDSFGTRHLFTDKLLWDENGFPYVENKRPSFEQELDGPRLK